MVYRSIDNKEHMEIPYDVDFWHLAIEPTEVVYVRKLYILTV